MALLPPFRVRTAGIVDRHPFHSTPGTRQGDVMLTAFLAGEGEYANRSGRMLVRAGMVGLVCGEDPGILMARPGDPYLHYFCRFGGEYARALAEAIIRRQGERFFFAAETEAVADCIRRMGVFRTPELPVRMGRREALLADALVRLQEFDPPQASGGDLSAGALMTYLRDHLHVPTDLDRIAEHFRVSRSTLCRKARHLCGETVQRLHEQCKIEWARTLLLSGALSVAETARRTGYDDPYYFSRVFKKHTGLSPRAWRQQQVDGGKVDVSADGGA